MCFTLKFYFINLKFAKMYNVSHGNVHYPLSLQTFILKKNQQKKTRIISPTLSIHASHVSTKVSFKILPNFPPLLPQHRESIRIQDERPSAGQTSHLVGPALGILDQTCA